MGFFLLFIRSSYYKEFSPLTSAEACAQSSRWLWKEICVSSGIRKVGNMCVTDRHDMTLANKVALNLNTTTT